MLVPSAENMVLWLWLWEWWWWWWLEHTGECKQDRPKRTRPAIHLKRGGGGVGVWPETPPPTSSYGCQPAGLEKRSTNVPIAAPTSVSTTQIMALCEGMCNTNHLPTGLKRMPLLLGNWFSHYRS